MKQWKIQARSCRYKKKQKVILSAFGMSDADIRAIAVEIGDLLDNSKSLIDSEPTEEEDDDGEDTYDIID